MITLRLIDKKSGQQFRFTSETPTNDEITQFLAMELAVPESQIQVMSASQYNHGDIVPFKYDGDSRQDIIDNEKKKQKELESAKEAMKDGLFIHKQMNRVCSCAQLGFREGHIFQDYVKKNLFNHRIGFCFGKKIFNEDEKKDEEDELNDLAKKYICDDTFPTWTIQVHCIYEPLQKYDSNSKHVILDRNDPYLQSSKQIINAFDMERLGWIVSHNEDRPHPLNTWEITMAAKFQAKYGDWFTTFVCSKTSDGQSEFKAYQVSNQGVDLINSGLILPHPSDPYKFTSLTPVNILKEEVHEIDQNWLVLPTPIDQCDSVFWGSFSPANRSISLDLHLLRQHLKKMGKNYRKLFSDFHLLVFLLKNSYLKLEDIAYISRIIQMRTNDLSPFKRYYEVLQSII